MELLSNIFIGLIAGIHIYIFTFECFLWEQRGPKIFKGFPKDLFPKTKALAFNQGVYNLFLAAGLIWSFFANDPIWQKNLAIFFSACVFVAGIAGAMTEKKIFFVQSVPAIICIILLLLR